MNPYQRYAESNTLEQSPEQLVVALYQCAADNVFAAERFNRCGDHIARGQAVNRALDVLTELTMSLNDGVELSDRLRDLYGYMQHRLLESHIEQSSSKMLEVASLITTLLSAWKEVATSAQFPRAAYKASDELAAELVATAAVPCPAAVAYGKF